MFHLTLLLQSLSHVLISGRLNLLLDTLTAWIRGDLCYLWLNFLLEVFSDWHWRRETISFIYHGTLGRFTSSVVLLGLWTNIGQVLRKDVRTVTMTGSLMFSVWVQCLTCCRMKVLTISLLKSESSEATEFSGQGCRPDLSLTCKVFVLLLWMENDPFCSCWGSSWFWPLTVSFVSGLCSHDFLNILFLLYTKVPPSVELFSCGGDPHCFGPPQPLTFKQWSRPFWLSFSPVCTNLRLCVYFCGYKLLLYEIKGKNSMVDVLFQVPL